MAKTTNKAAHDIDYELFMFYFIKKHEGEQAAYKWLFSPHRQEKSKNENIRNNKQPS